MELVHCFVKNTFIYICDNGRVQWGKEKKRRGNDNMRRSRYRYTLTKTVGARAFVDTYIIV